jgi:hypothetical protein
MRCSKALTGELGTHLASRDEQADPQKKKELRRKLRRGRGSTKSPHPFEQITPAAGRRCEDAPMTTHQPYSAKTRWTFRNRQVQLERTMPLYLHWEVNGDPVTDHYTPDEISARGLWDLWFPKYASEGPVKVYWSVRGDATAEWAPFTDNGMGEDFLTFFSWPVHAQSGERVNWVRLPVQDKLWHGTRGDKGGFIQELTGWKPSPFQSQFDAEKIAKLAGLR